MTKSYSDTFPDTPENPRPVAGDGLDRTTLRSLPTPTDEDREVARQYMRRVAPDLVDVLGLA